MYKILVQKKTGKFASLRKTKRKQVVIPVLYHYSTDMKLLRKKYRRNKKVLRRLKSYTLRKYSLHTEEY